MSCCSRLSPPLADPLSAAWIPKASLDALRSSLGFQYPEIASREFSLLSLRLRRRLKTSPTVPFTFTRMCWYSDVVDGDWVIDYHPQYPSLLYASGGAGHAFKVSPSLSVFLF